MTSDTSPQPISPLRARMRIDDQAERAWAAEWVAAILSKEGVTIDPTVKEHVWSALTSLASSPVGERTITGLAVLLQSTALKQALQPYCVGGPSGRLLDAENEHLGSSSVQAFETEGLIGAGAAPAVLTYLFHRIEGRLDGRPTLLIIDEGWLVLDDPAFAQQLREWLKTLRKKNASVVFATQSLGHRRQRHRACHRGELPDTHLPTERTRDRAADHRDLSSLRPQRSSDRDPRARHAEARLLLPIPPWQTGCSSSGLVLSRSPSVPRPPSKTTPRSSASSPRPAVRPSRPPGSPIASFFGPPISSLS